MKKAIAIGLISLVSVISSCNNEVREGPKAEKKRTISETEKNYYDGMVDTSYYTKANDGSVMHVREKKNGEFMFFRDKDNDGYADTWGTGFTWCGMPKIDHEDSIKHAKYFWMKDTPEPKSNYWGGF